MKPGDLRPVFSDPYYFKLAERKNGRYDLVMSTFYQDLSGLRGSAASEDTEKFIDIDRPQILTTYLHSQHPSDYVQKSTAPTPSLTSARAVELFLHVYANNCIQTALALDGAGGACVLRYRATTSGTPGDNGLPTTRHTAVFTANSYSYGNRNPAAHRDHSHHPAEEIKS